VRKAAERGSAAAETVCRETRCCIYLHSSIRYSLPSDDLRQTVKRYPLGSMLTGVLVGIYVGTLINSP
jgi:hypothetical protein